MAEEDEWPGRVAMTFGKHKGRTLAWLLENDPRYLDWLRDLRILDGNLRSAYRQFMVRYNEEVDRACD